VRHGGPCGVQTPHTREGREREGEV
jgi:hypothetical protein